MVNKKCKNCGKTYNETPTDRTTFFCTNRCANDFSSTPEKAKHKRIVQVLIIKESEKWENLNSEIVEDNYQHITRIAKETLMKYQELPFPTF